MWHVRKIWLMIVVWACGAAVGRAGWEIKVLAGDLRAPRGVALQPDTQQIFLIDSGRGRIVRLVDGQVREAIIGMPVEGTAAVGTPVGLLFLDAQTLLIACSGTDASERGLYAIRVPAPVAPPVAWSDATRIQPPWEGNDAPPSAWSNLVTVNRQFVLASAVQSSAAEKGFLARLEVKDLAALDANMLGPVQRWISLPSPQCLTISPRGEVVAVTRSPLTDENDGSLATDSMWRLVMYRATDQQRLLELSVPLQRLTGIIYSAAGSTADAPLLFALDQGPEAVPSNDTSNVETGGLYRLDAALHRGLPSLTPVKIVSLEQPTAIARGVDQSLLITTLGPVDDQGQHPAGQLLEIQFIP